MMKKEMIGNDKITYRRENMNFMAIDQYGHTYHGLKYPRKDLCERLNRQHVSKIYVDKMDGSTAHVGYLISGLWLTLYKVERVEKPI